MAFLNNTQTNEFNKNGKIFYFSKSMQKWMEMKDPETTMQEFVDLNYKIKDENGNEL